MGKGSMMSLKIAWRGPLFFGSTVFLLTIFLIVFWGSNPYTLPYPLCAPKKLIFQFPVFPKSWSKTWNWLTKFVTSHPSVYFSVLTSVTTCCLNFEHTKYFRLFNFFFSLKCNQEICLFFYPMYKNKYNTEQVLEVFHEMFSDILHPV